MINQKQKIIKMITIAIIFFSVTTPCAAKIIHVAQNNPNATDIGIGSGTSLKPFKTLSAAMADLSPGDEVIIGDGVYRESLILPKRKWPENVGTLITAKNPGKVLIKGSDIIKGFEKGKDGTFYINNWSTNSQQVFIDGTALLQIGGEIFNGFPTDKNNQFHDIHKIKSIWPGRVDKTDGSLPINSFYYNTRKKVLSIRLKANDNINNHIVEISVRPYLVFGQYTNGIHIKGLQFQNSNTSDKSRAGAITLRGNNIVIDNIVVTKVDSVGLNLSGNNNVVKNSTFNYCGQLGMKVRGKNAIIENNETDYNNTRGFNKWWEAGGVKIVGEYGLQDSLIDHQKSFYNHGDGIWLDWGNKNVEIKNSQSAYNEGFGIHYEASKGAYIHDNFVFGNKQRGIYLPHSSYSLIANNLVAFNKAEGIVVIDEHRRDKKGILDLIPRNNQIIGNIIAWNKPGNCSVIIPSLKLYNTINYNLYITKTPSLSFSINWPKAYFNEKIKGLENWQNETNQDKNSWSLITNPDESVTKNINNRDIKIDWISIEKLAAEYNINTNNLFNLNNTWKRPVVIYEHPGPRIFK